MPELFTDSYKTDIKREEYIFLLWELSRSSFIIQRELSSKLNISLGKTNYLLKELVRRGIIKIKNFSSGKGGMKKARYILTPKGLKERASLTRRFLIRKEQEYNRFKKMWEERDILVNRENAVESARCS